MERLLWIVASFISAFVAGFTLFAAAGLSGVAYILPAWLILCGVVVYATPKASNSGTSQVLNAIGAMIASVAGVFLFGMIWLGPQTYMDLSVDLLFLVITGFSAGFYFGGFHSLPEKQTA